MAETATFKDRIHCNDVRTSLDGKEIRVTGWVFRYRDQGGLVFIDLRDRSGIVQVVFDRSAIADGFDEASHLRSEFCISVKGKVRLRGKDAVNPNLPTGEVEILAKSFEVLNRSEPLPFVLDEYSEVGEEARLKFRYLDMRRDEMKEAMVARSKMNNAIRSYLEEEDFLEIETPVLNKSTPEGARDFLVPARMSPGKFYALPQSPQIFKQILMVGGMERYYQIVRCFRDEDLRADRQPEFTQLDMEMSFMDESMIMQLLEGMWKSVIQKVFSVQLPETFGVISYKDALEYYGTDRPDLRFEMKLTDIADIAKESDFGVMKKALETGGRVKVLRVPGGAKLSRKDIDDLTKWVQTDFKAGGLAWLKHEEEGLKSVIAKFFKEGQLEELAKRTGSEKGDLLLFGADKEHIVNDTLSALRLKLAAQLKLIPENSWAVTWVTDFPLFERDPGTGELYSVHHPFTAPHPDDIEILKDPDKFKKSGHQIRSRAYDLVINGVEAGGGSIRIHQPELQMAVLNNLGIEKEEADEKFGFLLRALQFGAPPHGGIAFGLDRMLMLFLHRDSIRDVIAFPKTQKGTCLMSDSPSSVDVKQLQELKLRQIK